MRKSILKKTAVLAAMVISLSCLAAAAETEVADTAATRPEAAAAGTETAAGTEEDIPASGGTQTAAEAASSEDARAAEDVTTGGTPWTDTNLKENITEGMELSAKDDFHLFVNYDWLYENEIPAGYRSYNAFQEVQEETDKKALAVLTDETLTGHDAELVQSFYRSFLDWEARDAQGLAPAEKTVEDIRAISSLEELNGFLCDPERSAFVPSLIAFGNDASFSDSSRYITYIYTENLLLDDAAEYTARTEMGDRYYAAWQKLAVEMLTRLGYGEEEARQMFEETISLEGKIAEVSMTSADWMSPERTSRINNVYTREQAGNLSPVYPLLQRLESRGYGEAWELMVTEPAAVTRINELYTGENLEALKNYMIVKYVIGVSDSLDNRAYDAFIEAANTMEGSTGREPDEKAAFKQVRSKLYTPMDRAYLEAYDASVQKEQVTEICRQVIAVYREMLQEEDWMSEETREQAIEKLDNIMINAVYPDKWIDYSSLDLNGLGYYDCLKAISRFDLQKDSSRTNGEVDRDLWEFDILEANAYYSPNRNSINLILGLLGTPFYYEGISQEELLGGIGVVIGHEISHAFDTNGAQFDKYGNFTNWWTEEDYVAFKDRADKLIAYYDNMTAWEGMPVRGSNIQTEAIADMAGMKAMLRIAKGIEGFNYDALFKAYATIWRRINPRALEYYYITQDPHPMHYLRTNVTVQQFEEFLETYDVHEGDRMYLAPEDRVLVW